MLAPRQTSAAMVIPGAPRVKLQIGNETTGYRNSLNATGIATPIMKIARAQVRHTKSVQMLSLSLSLIIGSAFTSNMEYTPSKTTRISLHA